MTEFIKTNSNLRKLNVTQHPNILAGGKWSRRAVRAEWDWEMLRFRNRVTHTFTPQIQKENLQ